jgi:hypothetical protein
VNNLKHYVLYGSIALLWAIIILFVVFSEPAFGYANNKEFIQSVNKCADYLEKNIKKEDRIPRKLLLAQAALESNYGRSRYAREGNNLMGIYQFKNLHTGMTPSQVTQMRSLEWLNLNLNAILLNTISICLTLKILTNHLEMNVNYNQN